MRHLQSCSLSLIGGLLLLAGAATRATADEWNKKTYITVNRSIEVPGAVLPPGQYVFKLLDSQSDRHIVQVMNARENHVYATTFAVPKERMEPAGKTILTFYEVPGNAPEPVRSWFYPGDLIGQEFIYPAQRMSEIRAALNSGNTLTASNQEAPAPAAPPVTTEKSAEEQTEAAPPPTPAPEASEPTSEEAAPPVEQQPAATPAPPAEQSTPEPAMPHTEGNTIELGVLGVICIGMASALRLMHGPLGRRS